MSEGAVASQSRKEPGLRQAEQIDMLLRSLRLRENEIRRLRTPQETRDFLAEKVWEVGGLREITSENGTWKIRVEPWDEVRARNLNKSSKGPIAEYQITVSEDFQNLSCKRLEDQICL